MLAFLFMGVGSVRSFKYLFKNVHVILPTVLILITSVFAAAQSPAPMDPYPAAPVPDPLQIRIERARALAAAHQLPLAANELENVRASVKDLTLRNVATQMLLGVYLEEGNYGRTQALLDETFRNRAAQNDESIRTYFAMAGQAINGVRSHLDRYRIWGINTGAAGLPPEVISDLDRVRGLLERMLAQAKEIANEDGRTYEALALLEDVLGIRLAIARDNSDRDKWQTEYVAAREKLASSQIQVALLGRPPSLGSVTSKIPNPFTQPVAANSTISGETTPKDAKNTTTSDSQAPAASSPSPTETGRAAGTPQSDAAEPKLISAGSLSGRETSRVTPDYPQIAKRAGIAGTVRVFGIVDENGKLWVTSSEGPTVLRNAAEEAARRWLFTPTIVAGRVVRVAGYLDFEFKQ
jgi:TonB family protein